MKNNSSENIRIVVNSLRSDIEKQLRVDYAAHNEKKSFRRIFSSMLNNAICLLLIQLEEIKNIVDGTPNERTLYNELFGGINEEKRIEIILHDIQKNLPAFRNKLSEFTTGETSAMAKMNYTKSQQVYIFQVIGDLFDNSTKMDKNDAPDFWMLHLSSSSGYLLTFDRQMIRAVKEGFPNNYKYISKFLKAETDK